MSDLFSSRPDTVVILEPLLLEEPCQIGEHTTLHPFSHIMAHTIIGNHCSIGHHVTIAPGVMIGNYVKVFSNAVLNSGVILEDNVTCGHSAVFTPLKNIRARRQAISKVAPTLVRRGACIGPNTTIASGVTLGAFSFIEAGSVIDSHVPDFAVVYGNPIRSAGWRCECGETLTRTRLLPNGEKRCSACGTRYTQHSQRKILQHRDPDSQLNPAIPTAST
jgi:UDP-2-acetamido-3-amino-2,3-dideoxy-glucuronate N-acetyltransferase